MRFLIFASIFSLLSCTFQTSRSESSLPFDDVVDVKKLVDFYNSFPGFTWKAGSNGFPEKVKLSTLKSRLGLLPKKKLRKSTHTRTSEENIMESDLPREYDARKAYPDSTTIRSIKDQGDCGSCWAVSIAATFSDRLYVSSNGSIDVNMSAEQLLACSTKDHGCNGGRLSTAWKYIEDNGLVTGGDYGSNEGCQPYSIPPSKDSNKSNNAETPACSKAPCPITYKATNTHEVSPNEYNIRKEIYQNGPVSAAFMVNLSLFFYKKGIYSRWIFDLPMGGHAVRVIGWGEENGKKYWIVANSWGTEWGEQGTFRISRGDDNCGIESNIIVALPLLS